MIIKSFELNKINFSKYNLFLLYGKNEGLKEEIIENRFTKKLDGQIDRYDENEFILNKETIISEIMNKSFFNDARVIIISRVSEKILKHVEEILEKDLADVKIILKSSVLDKRSKLRMIFEKNESLVTIPFYEETKINLSKIIAEFLKNNDIKLSMESVNLLTSRASGDSKNLKIELDKILNFSLSNKSINYEQVKKLCNLAENYGTDKLADDYLTKNKKNVAKILNENIFSDEDCVLILRTILNKSKRLLNIIKKYEEINDLEKAISSSKPPIFWKDKETVKIQVNKWNFIDLKNKIYEINNIEAVIKNSSKNSLNILSDFVLNY